MAIQSLDPIFQALIYLVVGGVLLVFIAATVAPLLRKNESRQQPQKGEEKTE